MTALLEKILMWVQLQKKEGGIRIALIILGTWLVCFVKPIFGITYTSWDTHDLYFASFLYFSDALKIGFFPLWNHFIQSGTFFPNLNNIGLFSPFQLIFVVLSWVISPLYAYELMVQMVVLIGGIGGFLVCRFCTNDRLIALFGATAFAVVVLMPIVGQFAMLVSLSSFPWLIFACTKLMDGRGGKFRNLALAVLGALYLVSGYLWMNLIHLAIAAIFSLGLIASTYLKAGSHQKKAVVSSVVDLMMFFGTLVLFYGCLMLPGYLSMNFNYSLFVGDYDNPEPRLRNLVTSHHYAYSSIYKALVGAIDPRIIINDGPWMADAVRWSWGSGWVLGVLFLAVSTKKYIGQQLFWLGLMIVALLYASGDSNFMGKLVEMTPILNANRWWFIGVTYATICMVFLVIPRLVALKERAARYQQFSLVTSMYDFQILIQ